jgi:hypothetical protein
MNVDREYIIAKIVENARQKHITKEYNKEMIVPELVCEVADQMLVIMEMEIELVLEEMVLVQMRVLKTSAFRIAFLPAKSDAMMQCFLKKAIIILSMKQINNANKKWNNVRMTHSPKKIVQRDKKRMKVENVNL